MTSQHSPENGAAGDDEREEDEEEESDAKEEEEEEEEEPRLKYQRMGGGLQSILSTDMATSIAVAERMIALGTHDGTMHILDFQGNQIKQFASHTATVNGLSFDMEGEFIGSCSDDGSVVINSLFTDDKLKFEYHRPMKAIALDPDYSRKTSRRFVTGGLAGQLFLSFKNWLGYNKQVLHDGEGPIHAVKWRNSLIAWANDIGVKVYDMANNQRIAFIERPRASPRPEILCPHLVWQDDTLLVIGWGTSVKIAAIRGTNQSNGGNPNGLKMNIIMSSAKYVDIVASFQTNYHISGIAPYGDALVVLSYIPVDQNGDKDFNATTVPSRQGTAQRPEVRIVTWKNDEITTDALPVHGYEHYKAKDYALAHAPFTGSSYAGGQWAAGDEPLYYIVSPKDIVIARPRDAEDHINWLVNHGFHEKALEAAEAGQGQTEILEEVGAKYLDVLIVERKYAEAAMRCPKLLRGSAFAWERWVFHFAQLRQLPVLVPYIPIENPRLKETAYEIALVALATNPSYHNLLLSTIKSWPPTLYPALPVISAIEPQLDTSSMTDVLKEALAELYTINAQYEKAFYIYADLLKPEIFDYIEKYNLHEIVHEKVVKLMKRDSKKTAHLLIQHRDTIAPFEIVEEFLKSKDKDKRYFLHLYLHSLFEMDMQAGREFHDMQVELYAEYDPRMLLTFLRTSQHYNLDKAYEILSKKELVREQVFVLGRMGNAKKALYIIINTLEDIQEAVEFVKEQHDEELWDEFIEQCLQKPEMVGMLLEHTVGHLDPLYIVNMVPDGLEIPRLRDRLVKIITDYRTETSLRQGCNDILKADCVNLLVKYLNESKRGIHLGSEEEDTHPQNEQQNNSATSAFEPSNSSRINMSTQLKSKSRGGKKCCLCFEPFPTQDFSVIAFFCCHAYHEMCLKDGLDTIKVKERESSEESEEDDEEEREIGESKLRCVLCTTAAG